MIPSNVSAQMQKLLEPVPIRSEELDELQLHLYRKGRLAPESRLMKAVHRQISRGQSFMLNVSPLWPDASWVLKTNKQESRHPSKQ